MSKKPIERILKVELTLKRAADILGHTEWSTTNDYLDADSDDDVHHTGYTTKDIQTVNLPSELDDAQLIFPNQVAMALENAERLAIAAEMGNRRREMIKETFELIQVVGEYQSSTGEMISCEAGIQSCDVDARNDRVTLEIRNPEHLINDLLCGRGYFGPELDSYEAESDDEIKSKLHCLGDYFDIYGARKPNGDMDRNDSPDIDAAYLKEEIEAQIAGMSLNEVADAVLDAIDSGRIEKQDYALTLAAKLSGKSKKEIGNEVKAILTLHADSATKRAASF